MTKIDKDKLAKRLGAVRRGPVPAGAGYFGAMETAANRPPPVSEAVFAALAAATEPLTVDEICQQVYGRLGDRERATVHQNLSRLDAKGRIKKHAMKYELLPEG